MAPSRLGHTRMNVGGWKRSEVSACQESESGFWLVHRAVERRAIGGRTTKALPPKGDDAVREGDNDATWPTSNGGVDAAQTQHRKR